MAWKRETLSPPGPLSEGGSVDYQGKPKQRREVREEGPNGKRRYIVEE